MSFNKDQNEPIIPLSNIEKRETTNLLPRYYRTPDNKKFLQATLDQLVQPGTVKKVSGFVGRESAKATNADDIFIKSADKFRQDYQLEPAAVIKDFLGNTTFYKDYQDHINHIHVFGGNVDNHSRLNKQEFYSWNPHIDWDKFVNFQQYYWLPFGPDGIAVAGQQQAIISEYTVELSDEGDNFAYLFTPNGLTRNPVLTLFRGQTYVFNIDAIDHPFSIKTRRTAGTLDRYFNGVTGFAVEQGTITFTVPENAPDVLFYVSETEVDTGGVFKILDIEENTFLDVNADVIGKRNYTIPTGPTEGVRLSNGMKLYFTGKVSPEEYGEGFWYVEGVGSAIKLVSERALEVRSTYVEDKNVFFDDVPFDELPYSEIGSFPGVPDYITINRSSIDNNAWSRYNRWFHKDVIELSAKVNFKIANLDQTFRAVRPIIEFNPDIKLYNYGIVAKKTVDVIDNFTKDVFSTIEGSLGYSVDGIDLVDGMRVLFNADSDILVKNKIYRVNFINVQIPGRQIDFFPDTAINLNTGEIILPNPHGLLTGNQVTYLINGNATISGLKNREIYYVKVNNSYSITLYKDQLLTKPAEIFSTTTGLHKFELFTGLRRQIHLTEEPDATPDLYDTVAVRFGEVEPISENLIGNQGQNYWFDGNKWVLCQIKNSINQPPLFDVFDENGYSYSDLTVYNGSSFKGTKIFSFKEGSGSIDKVLGFPLTYKNINNVGDIVFNFDLLKDSFSYKVGLGLESKTTDIGYLKISKDLNSYKFENGWKKTKVSNIQAIVRVYKGSGLTNFFPIDVFDDKNNLEDLLVKVYVNGKRLNKNQYFVADDVKYKILGLENAVSENDIVTIKCYAKQSKNQNGYYEIPLNLQNNPLNESIIEFTLGQVVDHVDTIVENLENFSGIHPGPNNLRDLYDLSSYGTRFVQHLSPLNLSLYHLGSKNANIIKSLDKARIEFNQFKRSFIVQATNSGVDLDPKRHVDLILQELTKDKTKSQSYYLSDMVPYTAANVIEIEVLDFRIKTYPLSQPFNLNKLSNKSVTIYLNGEQLIHGKNYSFGTDSFVEITANLNDGDKIEIYEYESTDGCFCPPTPTKLGIYPKFEPRKFIDTSYLDPIEVIQGHDGSITIAFGDYRDDLILELEKRIYNNIKVEYNPEIFDIYNYIPGFNRVTDYTLEEFNSLLSKYFFQWTQNIPQDFTKNEDYDRFNEFTFNYSKNYTIDNDPLPGGWRGIYRWLFDTTTPHLTPWEMLGYSVKPKWWEQIYGPAPYTSNNEILWNDLKDGVIRLPNRPLSFNRKFARPILGMFKPVDDQGNLLSPYSSGIAQGPVGYNSDDNFVFGDEAKVEAAWRRSSYYPFAVLQTLLLMHPAEIFGRCFDRSRVVKNLSDQIVYADTNLRIKLEYVALPSIASSQERVYTAGLVNYIVEYLTREKLDLLNSYAQDLKTLTNNIALRLGGFTSKDKFRLILDSKTPNSSGGVFVPAENYYVDLNVSSAIKKINYSGVVITKFAEGFELRGYNFEDPYFKYYAPLTDSRIIRVGGVSESFSSWSPGKTYVSGKIVLQDSEYYRTIITHTSDEDFNSSFFVKIPELPIIGGQEARLRKSWEKREILSLAYGTIITNIQDVVDIIQGYGEYLKDQGFVFDEFNNNLSAIANWETAVKEFLFWTTQNWGEGSVLSLSPAAEKIVFKSENAVVDSLIDPFYDYGVFRVDGQRLPVGNINVYRKENEFVLEPYNTNYGIYSATLHLVQKEHIVVLDNVTLFNDTIYDKPAGYRQEKIKVLGYITTNWNGGFEIPGFIYDRAVINDWTPWTDYNLGDIVKYKEFYYSATKFLPGVEEFNNQDWVLLEEKPKSELLPNFDYRTEQFTDFYDLDTDNFDVEQQRVAQHLTGYQKRQYLENIINNDVSQYKFYQGMIAEKGTQNALNKLFDVLSAKDKESLNFDEEWAFRVGEYGALDTFTEIEFILDEGQIKLNPQPLEIVDEVDPNVVDFVYRQQVSDVYIKPEDFTKNIWNKKPLNNYLRSPGYVKKQDVKFNVDTIEDLISFDVSDLNEGDYIWTAFEGVSWNVYRVTKSEFTILNAYKEEDNPEIAAIEFDLPVPYKENDVILVKESVLEGIYQILEVSNNIVKINSTVSFNDFGDAETIEFYFMRSVRINDADLANEILPRFIKDGETFWADNIGDNKWGVVRNDSSTNYSSGVINSTDPVEDLNLGKSVAVTDFGTTAAVANQNGIVIYTRVSTENKWTPVQFIEKSFLENAFNFSSPDFAYKLKFSKDGKFLVITDPNAIYDDDPDVGGVVVIFIRLESGNYAVFGSPFFGHTTINGLGKNISIANVGTTYRLAVSTNDERIIVYQYTTGSWIQIQQIFSPEDVTSSYAFDLSLGDNTFTLVASNPALNKAYVYYFDTVTNQYLTGVDDVEELTFEKDFVNVLTDWDVEGYALIPNHGYTNTINGTPFVYRRYGTTDAFGIENETNYYVRFVDVNRLALFNTFEDAVNNVNRIFVNEEAVFREQRGLETLTDASVNPNLSFGNAVAISPKEDYIAVSSSLDNKTFLELDTGKVFIYKFDGSKYTLIQILENNFREFSQRFGFNLEFTNNGNTLVTSSFVKEGPVSGLDYFDVPVTGFIRVDVYDRYNNNFIYGKTLDLPRFSVNSLSESIAVGSNTILVADPNADQALRVTSTDEIVIGNYYRIISLGNLTQTQWNFLADTENVTYKVGDKFLAVNYGTDVRKGQVSQLINSSGLVYSYVRPTGSKSWKELDVQSYRIDVNLIKKAFLYDRTNNQIVKYLDVVDPTQGKIPGPADQEIKFKTYFDPAIYSVGEEGVNIDPGMEWQERYVGMLWWDLSTARFLDNESGDIIYKSTVWNKLYETASIDIYEWVESSVPPATWDELLETDEGNAIGISGRTKYGANVYSVKRKFDNVSQTFTNTYYFWVKNKVTIPNIEGRTLSAINISKLIEDPYSSNYSCLALIDSGAISLVNLSSFIKGKNTVLSIQYWNNESRETNYHSQWKLLSTNRNTNIPKIIEDKWLHSLVGKDNVDRLVPDPNLPLKLRYGVEYRPRQSMFVNRIEALKQYVERVNNVLKDVLIADVYDISKLTNSDEPPVEIRNEWDIRIDSSQELRFVSTRDPKTALLVPIIEDGRIVGADITASGKGYGKFKSYQTDNLGNIISWYGPTVQVLGSGTGALLKTIINILGEVVDIVVEESGEGYLSDTTLSVRPFTVLVDVDAETLGWALYSYNFRKEEWIRTKVQAYDVNRYWVYKDWYSQGYNQFNKVNFLFNNTYELVTTEVPVGALVKIKNVGSGGWMLLEKFNNLRTIDYTQNYKVVGRENGTIQLLDTIYSPIKGFDRFLLDSVNFDIYPVEELRIIFDVVKNNLLVDDLKVEYLNLFFSSVRYALHEQSYLDWAFKTSFVKSQHNLGELKQKVTYNNDNLESFEQYIKEVKPYHTKIREYVSNYEVLEPSRSAVTDFDLLPVIDDNFKVSPLTVSINEEGEIKSGFNEINDYPWAFWTENIGFEITSIEIVDQGDGYTTAPVIEIEGLQLEGGLPARAKAYITKGRVNRIDLLHPGSKWIKAPTVTIKGSLLENGYPARAVAIIGNSPIRSNYIKVKFDRVSKTYQVTDLQETETFSGSIVSGSRTQFPLKWSPNINFDKYFVSVNGAESLKSDYTLSTVTKIVNGETRYSGLLTFNDPPKANSLILVQYLKNFDHLSATDRINFFYNPTTGQIGKDLSQLMTGVDYGGVTVTGLGFENKYGWDAQPWIADVWDGTADDFEDAIFNVNLIAVTNTLEATITFNRNNVSDPDNFKIVLSRGTTENIIPGQFIKVIDGAGAVGVSSTVVSVDSETELTVSVSHRETGFIKFVAAKVNRTYKLPFVPEEGEVITVYLSKFNNDPSSDSYRIYSAPIRIDDINYLTINQTNNNAIMTSFVGDGETDIIVLPESANLNIYDDVFEQGIDGGSDILTPPDQFIDGGFASSVSLINIDGNLINVDPLTYSDRIIFRKITSSGSIKPRDEDYDTELTGGDLSYYSATGFNPDDIILDGDGLVTPMTSHAPEEVVPGQIIDTLAIKVYTRPSGGAPNIMFKTYTGDGVSFLYEIGQFFLNNNSIIVKINDTILESGVDYTINYNQNQIHFGETPAQGDNISIISISFNSSSLLDLDYFVADGVTREYITRAPWIPGVRATVLVNGEILADNFYQLFGTDERYNNSVNESWRSRTGIRFLNPLVEGSLINYIVDQSGVEQSASVVKSETFNYTLGQSNYTLTNPVGINLPYEPNALVKSSNKILKGPSYSYFTLANDQLVYELSDAKYQHLTLDKSKINVYLNGKKLLVSKEYLILYKDSNPYYSINTDSFEVTLGNQGYLEGDVLTLSGNSSTDIPATFEIVNGTVEIINPGVFLELPTNLFLEGGQGVGAQVSNSFVTLQDFAKFSISLRKKQYVEGAKLTVEILEGADYQFVNSNEIKINKVLEDNTPVEVITFFNHNVLGIERTTDTFTQTVNLDPASLDYQEFLGKLGGTFRLRSTVPSGDFVWVIKNGDLLINNIDYYLDSDQRTVKLINYPSVEDVIQIIAFTNTVVKDNFGYMMFKDALNRTHYKRLNKEKSTRLVEPLKPYDRSIFVDDPDVLEFPNPLDNRPGIIEINGERIEYFIKDGNELRQLRRATLGTGTPNEHPIGSLVQDIGPKETIPYKDSFQVIRGNTAQHPNLYVNGTMQLGFMPSKDEIEVFVGGYRLKKDPYVLYNQSTGYPYSPVSTILDSDPVGTIREGDIKLEPEFTISGTGLLTLTKVPVDPSTGTNLQVTVVRKQGKLWNDLGFRLGNSENEIAKFITAVKTNWPD